MMDKRLGCLRCGKRRPVAARKHNDPYCSRVCLEKARGTYGKNHSFGTLVDVTGRRGQMVKTA